ncbi:MAG: hypothetical protein MZW92_67030 [Comamonadaceae bacterium]|nr:hypothetical protein [Comamonadaceae bacterium]
MRRHGPACALDTERSMAQASTYTLHRDASASARASASATSVLDVPLPADDAAASRYVAFLQKDVPPAQAQARGPAGRVPRRSSRSSRHNGIVRDEVRRVQHRASRRSTCSECQQRGLTFAAAAARQACG